MRWMAARERFSKIFDGFRNAGKHPGNQSYRDQRAAHYHVDYDGFDRHVILNYQTRMISRLPVIQRSV